MLGGEVLLISCWKSDLISSLNFQDVKKFDPRKSLAEKRKAEQQKKAEEAKKEGTPEKTDKANVKISQKSIDRLSAPKQVKVKIETPTKPEPTKTPNVSNLYIDKLEMSIKITWKIRMHMSAWNDTIHVLMFN